jgi:serine/threonine protein phosphatase PrpC
LLVATDGLHAYAATAAIVEAAGSAALDDAARMLIALPRLPSGEVPDDIAVVLVRVISRP